MSEELCAPGPMIRPTSRSRHARRGLTSGGSGALSRAAGSTITQTSCLIAFLLSYIAAHEFVGINSSRELARGPQQAHGLGTPMGEIDTPSRAPNWSQFRFLAHESARSGEGTPLGREWSRADVAGARARPAPASAPSNDGIALPGICCAAAALGTPFPPLLRASSVSRTAPLCLPATQQQQQQHAVHRLAPNYNAAHPRPPAAASSRLPPACRPPLPNALPRCRLLLAISLLLRRHRRQLAG